MPESTPSSKPAVTIPDHELIRPIGRGSYGEVWLARTVIGEYRAVKIIRRDAFDRDRPVERELEGIQKFEPISRTHENQVHILHVGRFANGFFYVMELADDAGASAAEEVTRLNSQPEATETSHALHAPAATYSPKTLRSELRLRGGLPVAECLDIALKLTGALAHLHGHGLVHRDVKPSNIIFVRGQPKLADIGLVASSDASLSCVGTEGFLPPEGPGKPQADLYALGKVLYEISTGRDRHDFPELPTMLRDDPQRRSLEELNEVVLKASDPDIRARYSTARAMHADLTLLRAGKSLQQVRRRERRWVSTRKIAAGSAVAAVLVALLAPWWQRPPEGGRNLPIRLQVDGAAFWQVPFMPRQFDFSPDGERIVFSGTNGISVWERRTRITRRLELSGIGDWKAPGHNGAIAMPRWTPDSRRFVFQAVRRLGGSDEAPFLVYGLFLVNADTGEARQIGDDLPEAERANDLCWGPNGEAITYVSTPRRLVTLSLKGERALWKESGLPGKKAIKLGSYSADGAWLLVSTDNGSQDYDDRDIWALSSLGGTSKRLTERAGLDEYPAWGPDGESVYFVSAGQRTETLGIWRVRVNRKTLHPQGALSEVLVRSGSRFLHPKFVSAGRTLAYAVEEPKTDVWIGESHALMKATVAARGQDPALSPDGQTIYVVGERPDQQGVFAISHGSERGSFRKITDLVPLATGFTRSGLSVSPDGKLIALFARAGNRHGIFEVPTSGGEARLIEELPARDAVVPLWSPDGSSLAYAADKHLVRTSRDGRVREVLATLHSWQGWSVRWSPDGRHFAAFARANPEDDPENCGVYLVTVADKTLRKLTPESESRAKMGLEWHPGGEYLTYMTYGPDRLSAQIRRAYLDGRSTDLMIDQPDHWDYVGSWAPDARRFFFRTHAPKPGDTSIHLYDAQTTQITHGLWGGGMNAIPRWSHDGRTAVWAIGETLRHFEVTENFR